MNGTVIEFTGVGRGKRFLRENAAQIAEDIDE